jgi:GAF domain-containing protein
VLCVPLREKEQVIGAIYLEDKSKRGSFSQQDLMSLQSLSQQVSERLGLKITS